MHVKLVLLLILEAIEDERREVLEKARAEAELEVAILRKNIDALKGQLKKARQPLEALKKVEEEVEEIEEKVEAPVERRQTTNHKPQTPKSYRQTWAASSTPPVQPANPRGPCCRMAT